MLSLDLLTVFALATIPASFSFLLDYALGFPGKEQINTKAIFFPYSLKLAKKRLSSEMVESMNGLDEEMFRLTVFIEGRKRFTWEQAFGMCSFCSNVWISLIAAGIMFFTVDLHHINELFLFLLIPIFSHSILRKL